MAYTQNYLMAKEDFRRQRRLAAYQYIAARLTGKNPSLLSFEDVSHKLRISGGYDRGIEEIPVDKIIGSVSRHSEFTRTFMPLTSQNMERWSRVKMAMNTGVGAGVPPIEVYKIGDAYFVIDGHNRVSVAREMKSHFIQARVTEIRTKATLEGNASPEDLILASEFADFLEKTQFDTSLPDVQLRLTIPGYYQLLVEHIQVHRYYMGLEHNREISLEEAVRHWYHEVFLPVKNAIADTGILAEFPGKTDADLYIWVSEHRYLLEKDLGWVISPQKAARSLAMRASPRLWRVIQRWIRKSWQKLMPASLQQAPAPGEWRKDLPGLGDCLFYNLLVPVQDLESSRPAINQALSLVRCPGVSIQGLHVLVEDESTTRDQPEALREGFSDLAAASGAAGSLVVESGDITANILKYGSMADLVVINVAHPTGPRLADRFGSGLRTIILRSPRPVLAVPGKATTIQRLMLAYDGSSRAREALFLAAFFAGKWSLPLVVVSVHKSQRSANLLLDEACQYLSDHDIDAEFLARQGDAGEQILDAAAGTRSDLLLMGGYGNNPVMQMMLGSTVDHVLRRTEIPVMICK